MVDEISQVFAGVGDTEFFGSRAGIKTLLAYGINCPRSEEGDDGRDVPVKVSDSGVGIDKVYAFGRECGAGGFEQLDLRTPRADVRPFEYGGDLLFPATLDRTDRVRCKRGRAS
jgi:hypothetical protein